MEKINLNVDKEVKTLTVLQGEALEQKPPQKIDIAGNITAPGNYYSVRSKQASRGHQDVDDTAAVVIVDKKRMTIKLLANPEEYYAPVITGKLEVSDELKQFAVNENKTFTKEELVKLVKFNKIFFDNADKHAEVLKAFQKIDATVQINSTDGSDTRGNKERAFVKNVTTNAPTEFILNIPVFKGFENNRFRVEICLDVTEGSARFWFESVELHELIQKRLDEIFEEELSRMEGLVVIYT